MKAPEGLSTQEGSFVGEKVKMSFDENAIAHLMSMLTDLYSDRTLATIREPASNAWDAHQRAGVTRPVEVTLPTSMDPTYIVKDCGDGMSLDTVRDIYSKYGASTKRDDNTESGYFGVGAKAPLTTTSSFSVNTTCDGVTTTFIVSRDSHGAGELEIIASEHTGADSGTEVRIPVNVVQPFVEAAEKFFALWMPGDVLVNGEPPVRPDSLVSILPDEEVLVMRVSQAERYRGGMVHIIQGNISYPYNEYQAGFPLESDGFRLTQRGYHVYFRVPMGTVNFVPSREALDYTPTTKETLRELKKFAQEIVPFAISNNILPDAPTYQEALVRARTFDLRDGMYRGLVVPPIGKVFDYESERPPRSWNPPSPFDYGRIREGKDKFTNTWTIDNYTASSHVVSSILERPDQHFFVTGVMHKNVPSKIKHQITQHISKVTDGSDEYGLHHFRTAILLPDNEIPVWLSDFPEDKIFSLPEMGEPDIPVVTVKADKATIKEEVLRTSYKTEASHFAYLSPTENSREKYSRRLRDVYRASCTVLGLKNSALVVIRKNDWSKVEDDEDFIHVHDLADRAVQAFYKTHGDGNGNILMERYSLSAFQQRAYQALGEKNIKKIDDPLLADDLRKMEEHYQSPDGITEDVWEGMRLAMHWANTQYTLKKRELNLKTPRLDSKVYEHLRTILENSMSLHRPAMKRAILTTANLLYEVDA